MRLKQQSICFVASTLPYGLLMEKSRDFQLKKIYVLSHTHKEIYLHLQNFYPELEVIKSPSKVVFQTIYFLFILLFAKFLNKNIIFFHECCLPFFDLIIRFIKPSGYFLPQVTMDGFEKITANEFPMNRPSAVLRFFGLTNYFNFYKASGIGNNPPEYVLAIKAYPKTIKNLGIEFSQKVNYRRQLKYNASSKNILFILGKTYVSNDAQARVFELLADIAIKNGYKCFSKDHPNPNYRLNLNIPETKQLNPIVPIEIIDKSFHIVVGVSSAALLEFGDRSISLIKFFTEMSDKDRKLCIDFFQNSYPSNKIKFIVKINEFEQLL